MKITITLERKFAKCFPFCLFCLLLASAAGLLIACSDDAEDKVSTQLHALTFDEVDTGLPKVIVNTPDHMAITSKEQWMDGVEMTIYNADGTINYQGPNDFYVV